MTDFDDLTKSYERHRQNLIKANDHNKAALFDALAAASITSVIVSFDGEGDSGQINHVGAFAGDQDIQLPQTSVAVQETGWGTDELSATEEPLPEAIERVCYNYLEQEYGGWENTTALTVNSLSTWLIAALS